MNFGALCAQALVVSDSPNFIPKLGESVSMALIRAAILAGLNTGFSGFSSLFSLELLPIVDAFSADTYTKSSRDRNVTNRAYHWQVCH